MNVSFRRYEILLPLRFNDGNPVPNELLVETLLELEQQFGAVSAETQSIQGRWRHEGQTYRDELVRIFVDVADLPQHREFFSNFKETLKSRFQQLDIWITTHSLEVL